VSAGRAEGALDAVIFDWGGTLTPWHTVDFDAEAAALAQAVVDPHPEAHRHLRRAGDSVWGRARDEHRSGTVADVFAEAGLTHDEGRLTAYREFWEPHTLTDPAVPGLFGGLRGLGLRVGILSNTIWPRDWHEHVFARDGVDHLIDGAVYSSEIAWTKPAPQAFEAAMAAVGATDPRRCVFVGDRLFDDIWGANQVGMRTVHVPHSDIPVEQHGHTEGEPDAVVHELGELLAIVEAWHRGGPHRTGR
jgi:putative hydrolase of the HAD superfamily